MWLGYRTPSSTKNEQTWNEANFYSGNLAMIMGILNIVVWECLAYKSQFNANNITVPLIGVPTLIGSAILLIIFTELHLRKIFDKNGNQRTGNGGDSNGN